MLEYVEVKCVVGRYHEALGTLQSLAKHLELCALLDMASFRAKCGADDSCREQSGIQAYSTAILKKAVV
jgi:hypothetical protein